MSFWCHFEFDTDDPLLQDTLNPWTAMTFWNCILDVSACGAVGGLAACIHKDAVILPAFDKISNAFNPGAIGTVLVGAFAAGLVWCLYSPSASLDIGTAPAQAMSLTIRELGSSGIIGFSGGRVLTLMAQQRADRLARGKMADAMETMRKALEKQGK